jgi:hypothetical protein
MSGWIDKFIEKHSKEMHSDVLNRVNHNASPQANIDRFKRELARSDAKTTELRNKITDNLDGLKEALRVVRLETGSFSLPDDHRLCIKITELQREMTDSDLIARETCQLIKWLEEEISQCESA